jgi:hypothetical protein
MLHVFGEQDLVTIFSVIRFVIHLDFKLTMELLDDLDILLNNFKPYPPPSLVDSMAQQVSEFVIDDEEQTLDAICAATEQDEWTFAIQQEEIMNDIISRNKEPTIVQNQTKPRIPQKRGIGAKFGYFIKRIFSRGKESK